jgi:hypothetical protein
MTPHRQSRTFVACVLLLAAASAVSAVPSQRVATPEPVNGPVVFFTDTSAGPVRGGPGGLGLPIAIFGKGFGITRGASTVTIGGTEAASYLAWGQGNANNPTLDMIVVQPGPDASGPVVVHVEGRDSNADHTFSATGGDVYYVARTGSDTSPCTEAQPCATIFHVATRVMSPGDALLVRGGHLKDDAVWFRDALGHSGLPGQPKVIRNYPGEVPVFVNASRPLILEANYITVSGLHFTGGKSISLGNITNHHNQVLNSTFRGTIAGDAVDSHGNDHLIAGNDCDVRDAQGTQGHCFFISHGNRLRLLYNRARGATGYGIHVFDQQRSTPDIHRLISDLLVEGNIIAASPERSGMILAMADEGGVGNRVERVTIRNNVFLSSNHAGLVIGPHARDVRVYHNTFYKNGRLALAIYDDATIDGVEVRNNLFDQTPNSRCVTSCSWFPEAHVQKGARSRNVVVNANYYAPGPAILIGTTDPGATAGPAGFASGDAYDFHLRADSPARGRGVPVGGVSLDFGGRPRAGTAVDPGAFEHP